MAALFLIICFAELTYYLNPPKKWWGQITYIFTWPKHLAEYIKEKVEHGRS